MFNYAVNVEMVEFVKRLEIIEGRAGSGSGPKPAVYRY